MSEEYNDLKTLSVCPEWGTLGEGRTTKGPTGGGGDI